MMCDAAADGVCLLCVFGGSAATSVALCASFVVLNPRRGRADECWSQTADFCPAEQLKWLSEVLLLFDFKDQISCWSSQIKHHSSFKGNLWDSCVWIRSLVYVNGHFKTNIKIRVPHKETYRSSLCRQTRDVDSIIVIHTSKTLKNSSIEPL